MSNELDERALADFIEALIRQTGVNNGWIRAVRTRQKLQGKELASRMRVSPARVSVLEKDELRGAVTLKMMQKAAQALDCRFVYALVPKSVARYDKPRIRLDTACMLGDRERQLQDLIEQFQRSQSKTEP